MFHIIQVNLRLPNRLDLNCMSHTDKAQKCHDATAHIRAAASWQVPGKESGCSTWIPSSDGFQWSTCPDFTNCVRMYTSLEMNTPTLCPALSSCLLYEALRSASFSTCVYLQAFSAAFQLIQGTLLLALAQQSHA